MTCVVIRPNVSTFKVAISSKLIKDVLETFL